MITIENADKALKDYYLQAVTAQLNDNISPFFSAIEKTSNNVYGKDVKVSVVRGNTDGVKACAEDADLPAPYKNRYIEISVPLKNIYGTIEISDKAMRASRDSSGAFVNLVNAEMEGLIAGAKYNFQRMLYGDGSDGVELTGLSAIFGEDDLYGYDRSDESYFKPYSKSVSGSLTENDLTDVLDYVEENFNNRINIILCSYATRRKIADLIADKKLVVNSTDMNTGFGAITVNGVPVYADKFCPDGVIYFLNTDDFMLCQLCDWEWLEDEDGKILKQIPGKAAYSATLVKYAELICKKPCAQAMLKLS